MQEKTIATNARGPGRLLYLLPGIVTVVIGLIGAGSGLVWGESTYDFLMSIEFTYYFETYLPYYPFVPFYPIFILTLGAFLIVKSRP